MAYVNMREILQDALKEHYAVGAFNIVDMATAKAVVQAAENKKAPVIIQTSGKTVKLYGAGALAGMVCSLAKTSPVPVALHLDHCKDMGQISECINAGWSSVMFDGSSMSFPENVKMTSEVVEMAHPKGVTVEGELGAIVGVEDEIFVKEHEAHLADPNQALEFVQETGVDCFAPAIGTAHGIYKGEPKIAFDRLEKIARDCKVPIAIHGGTGLSDEIFRRCIELGGAKINISTQIKHFFRDSLRKYFQNNPEDYEPTKSIGYMLEEVRKMIEEFIEKFGSEGKAPPSSI